MKIKKLLSIFIELLPILFLSFVPLFWYKTQTSIALGHDMGYPVSPIEHFLDRQFMWTERFGLGEDQQLAAGAFFIHGIEALFYYLTNSIFTAQKAVFIFWMLSMMLSFYVFARILFPEKKYVFLRIFGSIFYGFNHFFLQAWSIAERTKFSIAVSLPLTIFSLIKFYENKYSAALSAFIFSISIFFFNGGGNPPLFGSTLIALITIILFYFILSIKRKKILYFIKKTAKLFFFSIIFFVPINSYWLFPLVSSFLNSYTQKLSQIGGIENIIGWVKVISANATFENLFRLRGITDWYDNSNHPYSKVFESNIFFTLISYLMPITVFAGLFFVIKAKNKKRTLLLFVLLLIVSLIFSAGTSSPFGNFYIYLINKVPGFAVFRTPLYKFGILLWLSFGVMISFSLNAFLGKIKNIKIKMFTSVLILFIYLLYNYPYFNGSFFDFLPNNYQTMINKLPNHVLSFEKILDKYSDGRILLIPSLEQTFKSDRYNWGYWSTTSLPSTMTNNQILTNDLNKDSIQKSILGNVYKSIYSKNWQNFSALAKIINIKYLLVRNDYVEFDVSNVGKSSFEDLLDNQNFKPLESDGEWKLYEYIDSENIQKNEYSYNFVNNYELYSRAYNLVFDYFSTTIGRDDLLIDNVPTRGTINLAECEGCLEGYFRYDNESMPEIIRADSKLYYLIENKEKKNLSKITNKLDYIYKEAVFSFKKVREAGLLIAINFADSNNIDRTLRNQKIYLEDINNLIPTLQINEIDDIKSINKIHTVLTQQKNEIYQFLQWFSGRNYLYDKIVNNIDLIDSALKMLDKYAWITDENSFKYLLNIVDSQTYEIYLSDENTKDYLDLENTKIIINNVEHPASPELGLKMKLGEFFLGSGIQKVEVLGRKKLNLVENANSSYQIKSFKDKSDCQVVNIQNNEPLYKYVLELDYKNITGNPLWVKVDYSNNEKNVVLVNTLLSKNKYEESRAKFDLDPIGYEGNFKIHLCSQPHNNTFSLNEVNNLIFYKSVDPVILAKNINQTSINENKKISYQLKKINQVHYEGNFSSTDPGYISLDQSFNPNWKLFYSKCLNEDCSIKDKEKTLNDKYHYFSSGYSNIWEFNETGKFDFKIIYIPQKLYKIGWVVSIFSLVVFLFLYLLFIIIKHGKRN